MGKPQNDEPMEVHNPEPPEYQPDPPEAQAPDALAGAGLTAQDILDAADANMPPTADDRDARIQSLELRLGRLELWALSLTDHLGGPNKAPVL